MAGEASSWEDGPMTDTRRMERALTTLSRELGGLSRAVYAVAKAVERADRFQAGRAVERAVYGAAQETGGIRRLVERIERGLR